MDARIVWSLHAYIMPIYMSSSPTSD
jgi:hypothetical protein